LRAHLLSVFVAGEDFFEKRGVVEAWDQKDAVYKLDSQVNGLFSLEIAVADVKDLGHHTRSLLQVIKFNIYKKFTLI
jgi:hypothetical protein